MIFILTIICTEHPCSSNVVCLKMFIDWIRNCQTALTQHMVFISWILTICSTIYHGIVHLLSEKNRVANIYKMISVMKSWALSFCLSLIISFKVTYCSRCSSFITLNSVFFLFLTRRSSKASSIVTFVIFFILGKKYFITPLSFIVHVLFIIKSAPMIGDQS